MEKWFEWDGEKWVPSDNIARPGRPKCFQFTDPSELDDVEFGDFRVYGLTPPDTSG
jgi:hypothetical protein